jgi:hypothetical protein
MVNFGLNSASILGIFLAVAGAALYFLRTVRPELSRDHDIFFAAVGLLCGFILLFQGWRLDPILQFGQVLLTGSAIFFAVETIRLRGIATEQAKRNTPIVDDERPPSRTYTNAYTAEMYDEIEPMEEPYPSPRLRGTDPRSRRAERYESETRRPRSRNGADRLPPEEPRSRRPRPRPSSRPSPASIERWEADLDSSSEWEERPTRRSRPRPSRPESPTSEPGSRSRRRRPPSEGDSPRESRGRREAASTSDYVDYQPIEPGEDEDTENFDY